MRSVTNSLHFGEELKLDWLNQRLAKVNVSLTHEKFLPSPLRAIMPLFHASISGETDDDILDGITNTLLLQFGQFLGGPIQNNQAPQICRCQGVVRPSDNAALKDQFKLTETELRWRQELELLNEHALTTSPDIERCTDLFIATPKARFCSDACRFATFQFAKHLNSPEYHAEKQKRYRHKLAYKPESDGRKDYNVLRKRKR